VGAGIYNHVGSPGVSSGHGNVDGLPPMDEVLTSLRARLAENPEDIAGWKMLGRTQMTMQEFAGAVTSYEHAMQLENGQNAQTLVDLAIALLSRDRSMAIEGRPAALIESALALDPNNPAALFYSGVAASDRGDVDMAIARWEVLLGLNPPPEIRAMLEQRIAEWRGEEFVAEPAPAPAAAEETAPAGVPADAVVAARVSLSDAAINAIGADANVFIIARDPAQPSPPIAVSRLRLSELPTMVALGDAQSMVQGRALSGFDEFELVARVSLSGGPAAASGDWYGSLIVRPAENNSVLLTIDQQVP
jgi:cytochrome c-type biogenesis protein CcmH